MPPGSGIPHRSRVFFLKVSMLKLPRIYVFLLFLIGVVLIIVGNRERERSPNLATVSRSLALKNKSPLAGAGHASGKLHQLTNKTRTLVAAMELGSPLALQIEGQGSRTLMVRPRKLFGEKFQVSLGGNSDLAAAKHKVSVLAYEGVIVSRGFDGESQALDGGDVSVVVMGNAVAAVVRDGEGNITYVRTNPETDLLEARTQELGDVELACGHSSDGVYAISTENGLVTQGDPWSDSVTATLEPAALTGIDPTTGELDRYINRIPEASDYAASLKDAFLLLVLDKDASGPNENDSLAARASLYLATISNVAAAYENQLGVRLLLSELILIPDSSEFIDIAVSDSLRDFRRWLDRNRRRSSYGWTVASKYGEGLSGNVLGLAYVSSLNTSNAISICDTNGIWDVIAHEIGHNFGSEHSSGGIMNSSSLGGSVRSFFTDVRAGVTAAESIFQHAANRLVGTARMRDPEQMPFANRDNVSTEKGAAVMIQPLSNDDTSVRNGEENTLALHEVSSVTPIEAGTVSLIGDAINFVPEDDFEGTAWFSYTLRGNVGNNDNGWLHKADVGVRVGAQPSALQIRLRAGESYSFRVSRQLSSSSISQPNQALVQVSRDDRRLVIIRANSDASGTDSFRISTLNRTYSVTYDDSGPAPQPDRFVFDPNDESLEIYPLINDEGAGERWLQAIEPSIAIGSAGSSTGNDYFGTTFRLVSATNLTPELGAHSLPTRRVIVDGQRTNVPAGSVVFTPSEGASGTARIEYVVEDAAGKRATSTIEIVIAPVSREVLVSAGATARFISPANGDVDDQWMQPSFIDQAWREGMTGVGYERNSGYESFIDTDVEGDLFNQRTSLFVRIPFMVTDPAIFSSMTLRMRYDDGFVAYLNGEEIARANASGQAPLAWNATATSSHSDAQAVVYSGYDVTHRLAALKPGENVLAIHGLNRRVDSSDFLLVPELTAAIIGEGAEIVSPPHEEIAIPPGVGLFVKGRSLQQEGVNGAWSATPALQGDGEAVVEYLAIDRFDALVRFSDPGAYELSFMVEDPLNGSVSTDGLSVIVGDDSDGLPRGASIELPTRVESDGLDLRLSATVVPVSASVEWTQLSESEQVVILNATERESQFLASEGGELGLRLRAESDGILTFRDVSWVAGEAPAIALIETAGISDSGALLGGVVAGVGDADMAQLYIGTEDGAAQLGRWQRVLPSLVSNGQVSVEVDGLLANVDYFYRIAVDSSEDERVWSEAGQFRTLPSEPVSQLLLSENVEASYLVPRSAEEAGGWRQSGFDDSNWNVGPTGLGYDNAAVFTDFIATDIGRDVFEIGTTVYARVGFEMDIDKESIDSLILRMRYDDAFVAYLNGKEIARSGNAPAGDPEWDSVAPVRRDNALAVQFEDFQVSEFRDALNQGENVLAIHAINLVLDSRDMLISPEVMATTRETEFERWLDFHGLQSGAGAGAVDSDRDGISDLKEYAFGLDPQLKDSVAAGALGIIRNADGSTWVQFLRRKDHGQANIRYTLEKSDDLQEWKTAVVAAERVLESNQVGANEQVQLKIETNGGFYRVRIDLDQ